MQAYHKLRRDVTGRLPTERRQVGYGVHFSELNALAGQRGKMYNLGLGRWEGKRRVKTRR
jgi:hypothetical protein